MNEIIKTLEMPNGDKYAFDADKLGGQNPDYYQAKTDSTLITNNKTVVAAINENKTAIDAETQRATQKEEALSLENRLQQAQIDGNYIELTMISDQSVLTVKNLPGAFYIEGRSDGKSSFIDLSTGNATEIPVYKKVKIYGLTSIGYAAFFHCINLTSAVIGNGVESIGQEAFYSCINLMNVVIPDSVKSIGISAFYDCDSLTSVEIPDSVTHIGDYAFDDCDNLTEIVIPNSVTMIGNSMFRDCSNLTSVTIPDSVTSIGEMAFSYCDKLTNIVIPDSVTSIGSSAFGGCSSLQEITLPFVGGSKSATTASSSTLFGYIFGVNSYTGATSTTQYYDMVSSVTYFIPTSLTKVTVTGGNLLYGAFTNCTNLTSVEIGDGVESIGVWAFMKCANLTSITIPDSVTSIGEKMFSGCSSLASVVIPDSVTSIGVFAFYNCSRLKSIEIPDSVESIDNYAFQNCTGLKSITIPNSVTSIGAFSFAYCDNLTSVEIGDSVTSIYNYAFNSCLKLTNIIMKGSTVPTLGMDVFTNSPVEKIIVSHSALEAYKTASTWVAYIGLIDAYALISEVDIEKERAIQKEDELEESIQRMEELLKITATIDVDSITNDRTITFRNLGSNITINWGDGNTENYKDSVTYTHTYNEGGIHKVNIYNVEEIGDYAFRACSALINITLPQSNKITSIGTEAFAGCVALGSIIIPNYIKTIETKAFHGSSIQSLDLTNTLVTDIGNQAFSSCSLLTQIIMPTILKTLGAGLINNCPELQYIKFLSRTPCEIQSNTFTNTYNERNNFKLIIPKNSRANYLGKWGGNFKSYIVCDVYSSDIPTVSSIYNHSIRMKLDTYRGEGYLSTEVVDTIASAYNENSYNAKYSEKYKACTLGINTEDNIMLESIHHPSQNTRNIWLFNMKVKQPDNLGSGTITLRLSDDAGNIVEGMVIEVVNNVPKIISYSEQKGHTYIVPSQDANGNIFYEEDGITPKCYTICVSMVAQNANQKFQIATSGGGLWNLKITQFRMFNTTELEDGTIEVNEENYTYSPIFGETAGFEVGNVLTGDGMHCPTDGATNIIKNDNGMPLSDLVATAYLDIVTTEKGAFKGAYYLYSGDFSIEQDADPYNPGAYYCQLRVVGGNSTVFENMTQHAKILSIDDTVLKL